MHAVDDLERPVVLAALAGNEDDVDLTALKGPNGLVDATREIYSGNCKIPTFSPTSEFGAVQTFPFNAVTADSTGITVDNWT